jgi:hypothetical protein
VQGLGIGAYYVGRSDKFTMTAVLSIWALNLALLVIWAAREYLASGGAGRRPPMAVAAFGCAALIGVSLGAVQLFSPPSPWSEIDRIFTNDPNPYDPFANDDVTAFVEAQTEPDEKVLILRENGDLIARDAGVQNVSPISEPQHIIGPDQLDFVLDALAENGGTKVFTGDGFFLPLYAGLNEALEADGWSAVGQGAEGRVTEWQQSGISSAP